MCEREIVTGFWFNKGSVDEVRKLLANPLSVYDPMFVGNSIQKLCETSPLFPDTNRLLLIKEALNTLTPMSNDFSDYQEEVHEYYIRRSLVFRACFKVIDVSMPAIGDLRLIGKYKTLAHNSSLFFPLDWVKESNNTSNPLFSINTWKYLPVEYKEATGKAYINRTDSDFGDLIEVLAHRFYNTNKDIRCETNRLGRSSSVGFGGLSAEEFFVSSVKEVFYGNRSNKNKVTVSNTIGVNFVLYLISRCSTLATKQQF